MNPKKDKHKENRTKRNHNQIAKYKVITRKHEMLHRKKDIPYMENKEENFQTSHQKLWKPEDSGMIKEQKIKTVT